ncbi:MAG TPA: hypothetical protein VHG08_16885 [Longimicrobium sp.]|nr:hypothetical protein [Longimicrobium sp.]
MSRPARKLDSLPGQMDLRKLEAELLSLPFIVRRHLAHALLDSVDEEEVEREAHRRALEIERGEVEGIDAEEVIASLRARRNADVGTAWAEEAHRRWEADQRGEEEMLDFDEVMREMRKTSALTTSSVPSERGSLRSGSPNPQGPMALTVDELESELRRQPPAIRDYLAEVLLDSLDLDDAGEEVTEAELARRGLEVERGEAEEADADEVIAQLRARRRP